MTSGPRYFVILGAMRTGSNLLEKTLGQLGDTICYGEAFNPSFISGPRKKDVLGHTVATRDADPVGFLEHLITAVPGRIAGLRLFVGHSQAATEHVLGDPRCTRIILTRDPIDSFISLNIARKTDQWMLRNPRRRIETRIHFDVEEFKKYRTRLQKHYAWLDSQLKRRGTDAIRIDYSDLYDASRLQQVASQIGSTGTVPATRPILRQNPQSRAAKVENYAQMCSELNLPPEDPGDDAPASSAAFVPAPLCPKDFPIAYAPIYGPAFEPMVALLHRIETRDFGRPEIPTPELADRAHRGGVYSQAPPPDAQIVTMVTHPFLRLHAAFVREMFGTGWNFSALRRTLISAHGKMPPPRILQRRGDAYSRQQHQTHFAGFLDIVELGLQNRMGTPLQAEWRPQADVLADHFKTTRINRIFRQDQFAEAVNWFTEQMALPAFPPGQIRGLSQTGRQKLLAVEDVLTPELTATVMRLHARDFETFKYPQMPDLQ